MIARIIGRFAKRAPGLSGHVARAAYLLIFAALFSAACGQAPPRAASSTTQPIPPAPSALAPGQAQADPRGLGDPNAPITVIEYSDYQ